MIKGFYLLLLVGGVGAIHYGTQVPVSTLPVVVGGAVAALVGLLGSADSQGR
jgi:hypothetical protein